MESPKNHKSEEVTEETSRGATRRELFHIGNVLALPVLMSAWEAEAAPAPGPLKLGKDIYQSIGVEPVINCRGTFTIIGASVELPAVRAAMDAASQYNVQLDELADAVGRRLAELTQAEWGMVSAGCAAGLKHVTAACVAGGNPEKLIRIPDLTGFDKNEVVIPRSSRSVYDHAVRNIGVKIIMVDTAEEMANALGPRTAMIYLSAGGPSTSGPLSLEAVAKMAQPKNIPILVDAAAEILTIPNVHLQKGATIVAYSGGKAIRGPQCAGLLLGKKDILMSAWQASSPHHGPGRDNKVGREETIGMLAAVEEWVKRDHQGEWKTWLTWLDTIAKRVSTVEGVKTAVREPTGLSNKSPGLTISWDPAKLHITGEEVAEELATNKPRIALAAGGGGGGRGAAPAAETGTTSISITAWQMQAGEDKVVAERIHDVLSKKRTPKSASTPAPAANISGRWDVNVEFFSSKSQHTLYLTQDGNRLQGSHKGDFLVRDVFGTIEGDQVKLRSATNERGDSVIFTFAGALSGDTISGPVYMGEYLNAKFTAKRYSYPPARVRYGFPTGRHWRTEADRMSLRVRGSLVARCALGLLIASAAASAQTTKLVDAHVHHNGDVAFLNQLVARLEKHNGVAFLLVRPEHLKQVSDYMAAHPGRLIGFGDVALDDPKVLEQVDQFQKAGFRGLGEISRTRKPFDDPSYTPIYDRAAKYGMMLLFHTGIVNRTRPEVAEDVSVDRLRVTLLDNIARRYPTITIIGAHLGNPDYAWAGEIGRWNPNLFFDVSGSTLIKKQEDPTFFKSIFWWSSVASPHTPKSQTSAFEKIVFGSDVFGGELEEFDRSIERYKSMLTACGVSPEAQANIFGGTLLRILNQRK